MTPEWLEEIEKADEKAQTLEYTFPASVHRRTLLKACNTYRKAIEEAAHGWHCAVMYEKRQDACNCWKSQALNFNPKEVI